VCLGIGCARTLATRVPGLSQTGLETEPTPSVREVQGYWNRHPAGAAEVEHLVAERLAYFDERDRQTRLLYPNLDKDYQFTRAKNKLALEVGCGMGYNAQRLAECGAELIVLDLAPAAIQLTRERLSLRNLAAYFVVADVEKLPFEPASFEIVFSSGVIHHSPNTEKAAREIIRVLSEQGAATVMVYHRNSIWYWWNIVVVLGSLIFVLNHLPNQVQNIAIAKRPHWRDLLMPAGRKLTRQDVVRAGTDFGGLQNPLSRVYTKAAAEQLFEGLMDFRFVTQFNRFRALDESPTLWVRVRQNLHSWLDKRWGWFLIVHATKP